MEKTGRLFMMNRSIVGFMIAFFAGIQQLAAQDSIPLRYPIENSNDPTQTQKQSFDLGDPTSVKQTIVYDPVTGTYVFRETIGNGLDYRNPSMMTLEEYLEYERQKAMQDNWKEKIDEQTAESHPSIPPIKINSRVFENFFGSDQITITPQGSVELSFGINSSRYDNPTLPVKQRKVTRFDFNQQIQFNVVGQIGTKLKLGASYNTQAAFDFDNVSKLEYSGNEDQIVQKIALGNVALNLPTTLIQGSQTLFGVSTQLKFGRATVDLIAAASKGQRKEITISGKSQIQNFDVSADSYEANRHYFLNQYFRDNYDNALSSLPIVNSTISITRMEVWLTNKTTQTDNTRNLVAFTDLGEASADNCQGTPGGFNSGMDIPQNSANNLYNWASNQPLIRGFSNAVSALTSQVSAPGPFTQAVHYEKVENARKLSESEYSYNALLGFISLNTALNNDEVLSVAYEYTYRGQTYQVGEFSTDGVSGQQALIVKMLKPTLLSPKNKIYDLMMKNVYSIGAYQVSEDNFQANIYYNNPETSVMIPYFPDASVQDVQLVTLLGMDRININDQPFSDGNYDFVPFTFTSNKATNGGTINAKNGRIYLPSIEPFGKTLADKLLAAGITQTIVDRVAFTELYDSTTTAAQQVTSKNRFYIKGQYASSVSSEISLNTLNVPEGSVKVTAGGISLVEGVDFTVDYSLGSVKILNTALLESNTTIKISIESNSTFGFQSKTLFGTHYSYRFNDKLTLGATWVRMSEKPVTQKVDYNSEPFKNNMIGFNFSYRTEVPFLTKLVDMLPVISTTAKSTFAISGEFAHLIPGTPKVIGATGQAYVDDFEGAQSTIDLKSVTAWKLSSVPQGQTTMFPEAASTTLSSGFKRAKLAWYNIDYGFVNGSTNFPKYIAQDPTYTEDSRVRIFQYTDVFPNTNLAYGSATNLTTMDVAFYPRERGMYNYDTTATVDADGNFTDPEERWGGIMRALTTTNFETTNIEYIQFWVLYPFNDDAVNAMPGTTLTGGDLYFDLGNISEDILPDSRKSFENGLPADGVGTSTDTDTTTWARVSTQQTIVNAFDSDATTRLHQDVGLDGWSSSQEQAAYQNYVNWVQNNPTLSAAAKAKMIADPSSDDYKYYLDDDYDAQQLNILQRYKKYNGHEGNSPTQEISDTANAAGYTTMAYNTPDIEDINADNNVSQSENYFQYKVSMRPGDTIIGQNYITSSQTVTYGSKIEKWYQYKVPIKEYEKKVNDITDFRTIRFIRMFLKNFNEETVLRFAKLELVRSEWREYALDLTQPGLSVQVDPDLTDFSISTVNIEENANRSPINYVIPPGITRENDPSQVTTRLLNEQSLQLAVCDLADGDARAAYKNASFDVRNYGKLKMYVHGEQADQTKLINDKDLTVFVRLGTDYVDNYYEYEIPLYLTSWNTSNADDIWPEANNIEIVFDDLLSLKTKRNDLIASGSTSVSTTTEYAVVDPENSDRMIKVKGSPNLAAVKTIMIGIRNPSKSGTDPWLNDDGQSKCAVVWVNELRLTDFINKGGSAAISQAQVQLADFANVNLSGSYYGVNWGSVESSVNDRQRYAQYGLTANTTVQLGQFFGKQNNVSLPFFYSYNLGLINPEYDPYNPDIKLSSYDAATRKERLKTGQDYTLQKSYNFTNVRKELKAGATPHFWRISNWTASYAYTEYKHREFNIKYNNTKTWGGSLTYSYNFTSKPFEPFKNAKFAQKSKWLALIKDFNVNPIPKSISFTNDLLRSYNERQIRNTVSDGYDFTPVYTKSFTWNRGFNMGYDLTRNLKATFTSSSQSLFSEGDGQVNKKENYASYRTFVDTVLSQLGTLGTKMNYTHNYTLSYNIPLDKIPATDWISANIKYAGTYNWQRVALAQPEYGNIIQNSRTVNATAQMNFTNLYNKVPFFKKVNSDGKMGGRLTTNRKSAADSKNPNGPKKEAESEPEKPESEMTEKEKRKAERKKKREERKKERDKKNNGKVNPVAGFFARAIMSVRNVSATYALTDGTLLPGYSQTSTLLGYGDSFNGGFTSFLFGRQQYSLTGKETNYNISRIATDNDWLVRNSNLNTQYTVTHTQTINVRASLEPIKDVTIELTFNRNYINNSSEYYRWNETTSAFESQSQVETGTLTYTNLSLKSAFGLFKSDESDAFKNLLANRAAVSQLLGSANSNSTALASGYFSGYSGTQQEVVVGAFISAYSNRTVSSKNINPIKNIPLPNWSVNYSGLTKYQFIKKYVRTLVIKHAYSSTVSVSGLQTNLNATFDSNGNASALDDNSNYIAARQIQSVTMTERFSPLIGFDATWKIKNQGLITKFEYKKDRSSTLALSNDQVTDVLGNELVFGTGYKFAKVKLFKKIDASDMNLRFDLSIRDNKTIIRKIVENTNQATAGQKVVSIKSTIDYTLSKNVTVQLYYDQTINTPKVATSYKTGNMSCGLKLRLNLAGMQ